ncbi:MAG: sensor histidine kinase [Saprospiraceae bacterium]
MKSNVLKDIIVFALVGICCIQIPLVAQKYTQVEVDSLKKLTEVCDSIGLRTMGNLATHHYSVRDFETQGYYVRRQVECAEQFWREERKYKIAVYRAYYHQLLYNLYKDNPVTDSVLMAADKMRTFALQDTSFSGRRHEVIAQLVTGLHYFDNIDDYDKGFESHMKTMDLAMKYKVYETYLWTAGDIFDWYKEKAKFQEAYDLAEDVLSKVPDLDKASNKTEFIKTDIGKMRAELYKFRYNQKRVRLKLSNPQNKDYDVVFDMGKKLIQDDIDGDFTSEATKRIAFLLSDLEHYLPLDTLLRYSTLAVKMEENFKNKHVLTHYLHGKLLNQSGKPKAAKKYLSIALPYAKEKKKKLEELVDIYSELAAVNLKLGDTKAAQKNFDAYKLYIDSVYTRKNRTAVEAVETKYELSQQVEANTVMAKEAETLNYQLKLLSIIGGLLLTLLALAATFYFQKRKSELKLMQLNETKNKIFAILAHDLRSPISSLSNLSNKVKFLAKNNRLEELDAIAEQTDSRLQSLNDNLNNVLLWAVTESNLVKVENQEVYLKSELDNICNLYNEAIEEKRVEVKNNVMDALTVETDIKIFQTIARNLISNAIKFSYEGGQLEFSLVENKKSIELRIADNGIGLKDASEPNPSKRDMEIRKKSAGSGIGLKICEELAIKTGIKLKLAPNPAGGTMGILQFSKAA